MTDIEAAAERRETLAPDIKLGWLSLWIGESAKRTWLDVALEVRESSFNIIAMHGPMVQRTDFNAFLDAMDAFAAGASDEAMLASDGGSLRLHLTRPQPGWMRLSLWLRWGRVEHSIVFGLWQEALDIAIAGAVPTRARLARGNRGWRPKLVAILSGDRAGLPEPIPAALPVSDNRIADWESGTETGDVSLSYTVDGHGWYGVDVRIGDAHGEFGGGLLTDAMGDMVRGALSMLAGAQRFVFTCNAEPGLTRVTFERVHLRVIGGTRTSARSVFGCRMLVQEIDHFDGADGTVTFDAVCHSPRALAEAIYLMAAEHFANGTHPTNPAALAALEGALVAVRELERAQTQASGAP